PKVALVNAQPDNFDGLHLRTLPVRSDLASVARGFRGRSSLGAYGRDWVRAETVAARALARGLKAAKDFIEPKWPGLLAANLPKRTPVVIASSMPVRDAEYFWPANNRGHAIFVNRGANGIDGTLSTALGVAHGHALPAVLVTGDLALLHDTNGFLSVPKLRGGLTILLINNNGGGIFEHLPVAQFDPPFEQFFATPQDVDFAKLAAAYDVGYVRVR
ncbi:MAG: thiamine pyrophosphate-dependent enzyme, partial [Oleiharenicola lentus]